MSVRRRLDRLDRRLMRSALAARSPGLDRALVTLTGAADYSRLWLAIAGVLVAVGGRPGRRAAVAGVAGIGIAAAVSNGPAKLLVRRRRPSSRKRPTLIPLPRSTSFPSGHSAAAFAFATAASRQMPPLAPVLFPLAGAVAYSRVHTGVHFPGDVAAGIAIGVASGLGAVRLLAAAQPEELSVTSAALAGGTDSASDPGRP